MPTIDKIVITCESCDSKFYIQRSDIKKSGRFVRCTVCEHEWLVSPLTHEQQQESVSDVAVLQSTPPKSNRNIILVSLLCIALAMFLFVYNSNIENDDAMYWNADLQVKNISYEIEDTYLASHALEPHKRNLLITLCLENTSDTAQPLENIRISGLDKNHTQLTHITLTPHEILRPHAIFYLKVKLPFYRSPPQHVRILLNNMENSDILQRNLFAVQIEK